VRRVGNGTSSCYELVRANERHHPAHSAELVERIDALARYLGMGNYEPAASHKGKLKRARRLWKAAYSNFQAMIRDPSGGRPKLETNGRLCSRQTPRRFPLRLLSRSM
jgi:hypothetical protein